MNDSSQVNEQPAPRIEFPCAYPIRVVGDADADFKARILAVFDEHAPDYKATSIAQRQSKKGNYQSLSLVIEAQSKVQLERLFEALKATGIVRLVL